MIKSFFKPIALCFLLALICMACGKEAKENIEKDQITIEPSAINANSDGGNYSLMVNANNVWNAAISEPDSWISLSSASGSKGSTKVTVIVSPNDSPDEKKSQIIFKCGDATAAVSVSLQGKTASKSSDRDILAKLYESTKGSEWIKNLNWCSSKQLSEWVGITSINDKVTAIDLPNNNLAGTIPAEFGELSSLTDISFFGNKLFGTLPSEMSKLTQLKNVNLYGNALEGAITNQFSGSTQLQSLNIDGNNITSIDLSGNIGLKSLFCSSNKLQTLDLASNIQLEVLWCSENEITSISPDVQKRLSSLHCDSNDISKIDASGNTKLTDINASDNKQLTDISLSGCSALEEAYFSNCAVESIDFENCGKLSILYINGNSLKHLDISGLQSLTKIDCSQNPYLDTLFLKASQKDIVVKDGYTQLTFTDYNPYEEGYQSTDYSKDGEVTLIHEAKEGNGINLILMGDGFSDRMINDGTYMSVMERAQNAFFREEPFKTFENFFNVYVVTAVSKYEVVGKGVSTAFDVGFGNGTTTFGNINKAQEYAEAIVGAENFKKCVVAIIANENRHAGTCYLGHSSDDRDGDGDAVAIIALTESEYESERFEDVFIHEVGGHGFAKLADEYYSETSGSAPEYYIAPIIADEKNGYWKNIDVTDNPDSIKWKKLLTDTQRYSTEEVGIYEGANGYSQGIWRSSPNSIMKSTGTHFNAVSREAIFYRIHRLAYGEHWQYEYEKFAEYDKDNKATENIMTKSTSSVQSTIYHCPPIVSIKK